MLTSSSQGIHKRRYLVYYLKSNADESPQRVASGFTIRAVGLIVIYGYQLILNWPNPSLKLVASIDSGADLLLPLEAERQSEDYYLAFIDICLRDGILLSLTYN